MNVKLEPGFRLEEATDGDKLEIWQTFLAAFASDELWIPIVQNVVHPKKITQWICTEFALRWYLPDVTIYKITENATRRIAGWGAIIIPWRYRKSTITQELKDKINSSELPPLMDGMNKEALFEFFRTVKASVQYGYDPENDYRTIDRTPRCFLILILEIDRLGSVIHPDFQRRGFGTYLAQYFNQISDARGDRQWVAARPSSVELFKKNGFSVVGAIDSNLERWGGSREGSTSYILVHYPPTNH
ncbi:hypothetical protein Golomagni_04567 [Golovinomyces magnicellulatus]|nr:hypothetical protein Golomagni_04567 [Golovinomyces magnicellulatus]